MRLKGNIAQVQNVHYMPIIQFLSRCIFPLQWHVQLLIPCIHAHVHLYWFTTCNVRLIICPIITSSCSFYQTGYNDIEEGVNFILLTIWYLWWNSYMIRCHQVDYYLSKVYFYHLMLVACLSESSLFVHWTLNFQV